MWVLIVSVPDHYLSFYFDSVSWDILYKGLDFFYFGDSFYKMGNSVLN